ncbi:hypothetical protein FRB99_005477 [Tulasnella sp. 403]|nr:hypothetical protein FRB99_005477 [Tulasnella sp. 403]
MPKIIGRTLQHDGWPNPASRPFQLEADDRVMDLCEQCEQKLGLLSGAVAIWKLRHPVALENTEQLNLISLTHVSNLGNFADLMEEGSEVSSLIPEKQGPIVTFAISPSRPLVSDKKRKCDENTETESYIKRVKMMEDPSSFCQNHEQTADDPILLNHRPAGANGIPTELLDPLMGRLRDNLSSTKPIRCDVEFTVELCSLMSQYYTSEAERLEAFREPFQKYYAVYFHGVHIERASTEASAIQGRFFVVNIEGKNRPGDGGDPSLQNAAYYAKKLAEMEDAAELRLPMILIDIAGPELEISAAVFGPKVTIDPLIRINLASAPHDIAKFVTVFAGLRVSMKEFAAYYSQPKLPTVPPHQRQFPYYNGSADGAVSFSYEWPLVRRSNHLVFLVSGRVAKETKGSTHFVVKFTLRYGTETHRYCAEAGFAPQIYHMEELPGGWTVVVMEFISKPFTLLSELGSKDLPKLDQQLRHAVSTMHDEDYVHGDLRGANVFGDPDTGSIRIIDWDWAGKEGSVKYPLMVIPTKSGIEPLRPISKAHDLEAMEVILKPGIQEDVCASKWD